MVLAVIKIAFVLVAITVVGTEDVFAFASKAQKANLFVALPTVGGILLLDLIRVVFGGFFLIILLDSSGGFGLLGFNIGSRSVQSQLGVAA